MRTLSEAWWECLGKMPSRSGKTRQNREEPTSDQKRKINQKDKYRRDSINVIDQALLNKKKREAEQLKLDQKKNEFQSLLKKAQYNLGNKYTQNYGVINTQSGFLKKEHNTLMFGKSLKNCEYFLVSLEVLVVFWGVDS